MSTIEPYIALALQTRTPAVNSCGTAEEARAKMRATIDMLGEQILGAVRFNKIFSGGKVGLVVLPEYFLTGFPFGESITEWRDKAALAIDGPEYQALGEIARQAGCYIGGNLYETDAHFPELYFQACIVIDPQGEVILRYRRLISMFAPSPYDVWDKYLEIYGQDAIFPVADTEIGRLGAVASEEILYPELVRCMALNGAEVLIHPTSETGSPQPTPKGIARRARAYETKSYIVSANSASVEDCPIPEWSSTGMSTVIDYNGAVLSEAHAGPSMVANGTISIDSLRHHRSLPGMANTAARLPLGIFAAEYGKHSIMPMNTLLKDDGSAPAPDKSYFMQRAAGIIAAMKDSGKV